MSSNVVDHRPPAISRRTFLQAIGLTVAAGFTAISDGLLKWLTQACRFDASPRLAAAG